MQLIKKKKRTPKFYASPGDTGEWKMASEHDLKSTGEF